MSAGRSAGGPRGGGPGSVLLRAARPGAGPSRQLGANQRAASGARSPARAPRPRRGQQWQRRLRAEREPGRGGAEPRGILESAGRWGFWEESSISSFPPASPLHRHPKFPCAASRGAERGAAAAAGECWACTCRTGSP